MKYHRLTVNKLHRIKLLTMFRPGFLMGHLVLLMVLGYARPGLADEPPQKITRLEALQLAASKNLALIVQRLEARRTQRTARAEWRPFSPALVLDAKYQGINKREMSTAGSSKAMGYAAGLEWQSPIGTKLDVRARMHQGFVELPRLSNDFSLVSIPPRDGVSASLSLVQPLLKGGWLSGAALKLQEAELANRIQRELLREELNNLLVEVESSYWDLAVAEADLAIRSRSYDRATQQYEYTAENIRRGLLADGEIYVVEDNVVFFQKQLVRAQLDLALARRRIAELLLLAQDAPISTDEPLLPPTEEALKQALTTAESLQQSPKLAAQQLRCQLAQLRLDMAVNQTLPSLDLATSVVAFRKDVGLAESWRGVMDTPLLLGHVGLTVSAPLDFGAIGANLDAARLALAREEAELISQQNKLRYAIENQYTDLVANGQLVTLSQRQVALAERKLSVETEKYKNGVSTLVDVVRFQRDLDEALSALQDRLKTVYVGRARLLAYAGMLHDAAGIGVE